MSNVNAELDRWAQCEIANQIDDMQSVLYRISFNQNELRKHVERLECKEYPSDRDVTWLVQMIDSLSHDALSLFGYACKIMQIKECVAEDD